MPEISDKSNSHKINEIKTILRSLLISEGSRDVTVHLLNTRYKDMEDRDIPFKDFNYSNLTDFLRSMTDTLKLKFNKDKILCVYHINSEKSAHISSLVARQKKPPKKIKSTYSDRSYTNYSSFNKPNQTFFPNYIDILNQVLQEVKCSGTASIRNGGIRKSEILSRVKNRLGNQFSNSYTIRTLNEHLYKISHMICIENDYIYFKDRVNKNGINNTQENCTTKIVASNSDSFNTLEANNDPFPILNDNEQNLNSEINSSSNITEQTKIRLQKLLQKHPEGIWCSELPNLYRYDYNIDLEYSDLGFNSITEFVAALPNIFQIVQPPNSNRQMVLCPKTFTNSSKSNHQTKTLTSPYNFDDFIASDQEPVPIKLSIDVSRKLVPDGVMSLNETVDQICITSLVHEEYIEVNISEIFTPSFFWITLRKNKKKIQALMNELEEFYNKEDLDTYKIPQVILKPGLNVACTYSKVWHRGIVKKIKPDGFVVILFYDYGTIKTYNPNDLYFLNKKFSHLSAQAVACGLYNIKPIGGSEWSNESINKFIDKVWNIPFIAIISSINEENNTMMITLTDTSDDLTDLHINDWMIENKLAAWGKMIKSIPVHTMCMYDELVLLDIREDRFKNTMNYESINNTNTEKNGLEYVNTAELSISNVNESSENINFSCDSSNVPTLIKENMYLTQQTNTVAQAILLSNDDIFDNNNSVNKKEANGSFENVLNIKTSNSKDCNKQLDTDLNTNSNGIDINVSEISNNCFGTNNMHNKPTSSKQNFKDYFDHRLSMQSLFPCSLYKLPEPNDVNYKSESILFKQYLSKHYNLNFEDINKQEQNTNDNTLVDYDNFSFDNGTICFDIKSNSNITKPSCINIKNPSHFVNMNINKYENNDDCKNMSSCKNDDKIQDCDKEQGEGYITRLSTSKTCSNLSLESSCNMVLSNSMYIVINLSKRCDEKNIHLFHLDNEGWICTKEFIDAFTNLKDQRVMFKLLKILDCEVNFKLITRDTESKLFSLLDRSTLKAPREKNKKIIANLILNLMPLKAMLQILVKLDFLNAKMLKAALPLMKQYKEDVADVLYEQHNNKILFDVLNLLVQYKQFRSFQRSSS